MKKIELGGIMNPQRSFQILTRSTLACALLVFPTVQLHAQQEDWTTPFPGHRVIANLYAVGTYGLGVFLITSEEGHILINTGLEDSTALIQDNIESVGYRLEYIKILLTMQSHWDHTAALAEIKEITGAEMWATADDARVLEDGGFSDPHFGGQESFRPVSVDKIIHDGETIELGDIRLLVHEHSGHTEGSSSYSMRVHENDRDYDVVIANMGTINAGKKLVLDPTYPNVANDFAETFRRQKAMDVDVWVAAHGGQYGLHDKYKPGQAYSPDTFIDPDGFLAEVERLERTFLEQFDAEEQEALITPFPGHRVISNLYSVGTYDLGVFLITSDEGHILINTGLEDSTPLIRENIESVGYRLEDVKILLTMQSHWDHTLALAEIKEITGAEMWATADDARVLEDGGFSDPQFGRQESFMFEPVSVDKIINDGETIELGDIRLLVHEHPGHTEGSSSYSMHVRENGRDYDVVIANMGFINPGKKLVVDPTYPGVANDFASTFRRQKAMDVDVWVAAHGNQYGLHHKHTPGQVYSPDTFVDPDGFLAEVERMERAFLDQLAAEQR